MNDEPNSPQHPILSEALLDAIQRVLRPLIRLFLQLQITYPFVSEWLKRLYVDVAEREFGLPGKKQTDTRISLLTGVHRKDTRRLRQQALPELTPQATSIGAQLIAHWIADPTYLDADGKPAPLALKGEDPPFEQFVQRVCKQDMRARVVLDEWLRQGIIEVIDDHAHLKVEAFVPATSLDDKAFFLGLNVGDHLTAASTNLNASHPPFLERCVYYSGLSDSAVEQLHALAREKGMETLKQLNDLALKLSQEPASQGSLRFTSGVYFYHADEEHS